MRDIFTPLLSASWLNSPMSSLRPALDVGEYLSLWNNLNNNRMGVILAWGKSSHRTFAMGVRCLSRSNSVRILSSLFRFAAAMALMMGSSPRGAATQDGMVTHPHTTHDADGCLHKTWCHPPRATDTCPGHYSYTHVCMCCKCMEKLFFAWQSHQWAQVKTLPTQPMTNQAKPTDACREQTHVMIHQATATDAWGRAPLGRTLCPHRPPAVLCVLRETIPVAPEGGEASWQCYP